MMSSHSLADVLEHVLRVRADQRDVTPEVADWVPVPVALRKIIGAKTSVVSGSNL